MEIKVVFSEGICGEPGKKTCPMMGSTPCNMHGKCFLNNETLMSEGLGWFSRTDFCFNTFKIIEGVIEKNESDGIQKG